MFRAAAGNIFDTAVAKATDENLTSENWEYILDVCDKVGSSEAGGRDATAAMIKRLAHRNANVQLYTLELANALSQNCGIKIHKELASRSFTDALLRLTADRNTHPQVKTKIFERMGEWSQMFRSNPDLGIMDQAYMKLKTQNPHLQPPSKPFKQEMTDTDRRKEDDELQMALALSLKEQQSGGNHTSSSQAANSTADYDLGTNDQPLSSGTTAATVSRVRALYDFKPSEPGELEFRVGDVIAVLESVYKDWWKGSLRGNTGIFPLNYVEKLQDPTQEELQREAHMEADVFGEMKNVERLLALLSTGSSGGNVQENDEITRLYQSVVAIRPKLVELIAKYSQKKDDFTQLNEKFIKARRDYETLLEASMSQPPPSQYGRPPQPMYSYGGGGGYPPPAQQQQQYYPPQQQPQESQYPPRDGPAPFYMIPPGQQQQQQASYPPAERTHTPAQAASASYGAPQSDRRSAYNPQELPTTPYDPNSHQHQPSYPPLKTQHQQPSFPPPQAQQQQYAQPPSQHPDAAYQQPQHTGSQYYPPPQQQAAHAPDLTSSPQQLHSYPPPQQQQQQQQQQLAYDHGQQGYPPHGGESYPPPPAASGVAAGGDGDDASDYYR